MAGALQQRRPPRLEWPRLHQRRHRRRSAGGVGGSTTAPGGRACSSPSTSGRAGAFATLPLVPEWYLVIIALAGLSALGALWTPLLLALPLFVLAAGALVLESVQAAHAVDVPEPTRSPAYERCGYAQPSLSCTCSSRCRAFPAGFVTGWRRGGGALFLRSPFPDPVPATSGARTGCPPDQRLAGIDSRLRQTSCAVLHGSEYDRWDLEVRGGITGATRLRLAVEEHGAGTQLVRLRSWPRYSGIGMMLTALLAVLAAGALLDGATIAGAILGAAAFFLAASAIRDCAAATGVLLHALAEPKPGGRPGRRAVGWTLRPGLGGNDGTGGRLRGGKRPGKRPLGQRARGHPRIHYRG